MVCEILSLNLSEYGHDVSSTHGLKIERGGEKQGVTKTV